MDSFNPNTTIGAFQIGVLASYLLFGVTTTQTYIYYGRFPDDSTKHKALVAFIWSCEAAHALCIGHTLYTATISDYGHPERIFGPAPKSFDTATLLSGVVAACVQGFFAFRIYTLSKRPSIPILCWIMSFLDLLGNFVIFVTLLPMTSVAGYEVQWEWLLTAVWSVSAANDLTITATLVFILYSRRTHAQQSTVALVDKLIVWTIETGMLTSAAAIVMLACFVKMKSNFIWLAVFTVVSRLYANSLLARTTLRAMRDISLRSSARANGLPSNGVQMTKVTHVSYDEPSPGQCDKFAPGDV
ncbi:hypothetical protein B0H13DRAFT_2666696 [Mycena leptocephala]|nr:hypothetical protein B0H13DRAFT_2666696 [Mycena leptocephala]